MIKYSKKLTGSLFAKVFFLTVFLLIGISMLVYVILAYLTPQTYSNHLNTALDKQAQGLVAELEQVPMANSGGLFSQFLQNPEISYIELYSDDGTWIPLPDTAAHPTSETTQESSAWCVASEEATHTESPVLAANYYFSFADDSTRYLLIVYGPAKQIAQLKQAFFRILPALLLLCIAVALIISFLYAHIITKPVLKLCSISKKMSALQFDWRPAHTRSDELGILEDNLYELSKSLAAALAGLQDANDRLLADIAHEKALEQARTDFFSAVSHELKTPVTVIKGQLEGMLLGIGAYKNHKKYLAKSLETTEALEHMVQEIVTISRLEAANASFPMQHFDCAPLIRGYLNTTEDLITSKELHITCDLPPTASVTANKLLLEKTFSNLIGNAIKYAPPKADIHILLTADEGSLQFCVENSGTHIPDDCLPKLFDAFYRVEQSRSRKTGGSGLGLYLVQKILAQHKSYCTVSNTPNGVQFSFSIQPLHEAHLHINHK